LGVRRSKGQSQRIKRKVSPIEPFSRLSNCEKASETKPAKRRNKGTKKKKKKGGVAVVSRGGGGSNSSAQVRVTSS